MAVFTPVTPAELNSLLAEYSLGPFQKLLPATSGIENTTYLLTTQSSSSSVPMDLVLTIFEMQSVEDVNFYTQLLAFLHQKSLPVPRPLAHPNQGYQQILQGKPAVFFTKIPGKHLISPSDRHAEQISIFLARLHQCAAAYPQQRSNSRDFDWIKRQQLPMTTAEAALLKYSIQYLEPRFTEFSTLPAALIHGDLFVDNALFVEDKLSGVIDFYNAHTGPALWDLAIAVLAWCSDHQGELNKQRVQCMLTAYQQVRPLTMGEQNQWMNLLCYAALRFWVSRLIFWHEGSKHLQKIPIELLAELRQQKHPSQFKHLLQALIEK